MNSKQESTEQETESGKMKTAKTSVFVGYLLMRRLMQTLLVLIILFMSGFLGLWLYLQQGPLDLSFVKTEIEEKINQDLTGYRVDLGKPRLTWNDFKRPLLLSVEEVKLYQGDQIVSTVKDISLGVHTLPLLIGEFRPSYLQIISPELQLLKTDNKIEICCGLSDEQLEQRIEPIEVEDVTSKTSVRDAIKDFRASLQIFMYQAVNEELSGPYEIFNDLKEINVSKASAQIVEDQETIHLGEFDLNLVESGKDISGRLRASIPDIDKSALIDTEIVYRGQQQDLTFNGLVKGFKSDYLKNFFDSDHFINQQDFIIDGDIKIAFDKTFRISMGVLDVAIPEAKFNVPAVLPDPFDLKEAKLKAYINRDENILNLETLEGVIADIPIHLSANGLIDRNRLELPLNVKISKVDIQDVQPFIPEPERVPSPEAWLKYKISKGIFENVEVSANIRFVRDPETKQNVRKISDVKAKFDFRDAAIAYSDTLLPATDAKGSGTFENDRLLINATEGKIKDITASKVTVDMEGLSIVGGGTADINIDAEGPLNTVLEYISADPLNIDEALSFSADQAQGAVSANVRVQFPTVKGVKKEDFKVTVKGQITDALIPSVVNGLPLSGGPFDLQYKEGSASLSGAGRFADRPISLSWFQNLDAQQAEDQMSLQAEISTDTGLRKAFGIDLDDYVTGVIPITLDFKDKGKTAIFNVDGDLTNAVIALDQFNYKKEEKIGGTVSFDGFVEEKDIKEIDNLSISTAGLIVDQGRILFQSKGSESIPHRGSIGKINLGQTDLKINFEMLPEGPLKVVAEGPVVDYNAFFSKEGSTKSKAISDVKRPQQISLTTPKMLMKNNRVAENVKLYFETDQTGSMSRIEMDTTIGQGVSVIRLKPDTDTGNTSLIIDSPNAGQFLSAFGIYKNISGGVLRIQGQPRKRDENKVFGSARIDNFKVRNAPVLARLLNTLSLPGILGLLNNDGLTFSRLESNFEWRLRDEGDLIVVKNGRTSGASIGLTFEGVMDRDKKDLDISGTVIPMSQVNNLISNIPVVGEILTGGDALLAATYTVKGQTSDPKTTVNPLSVLAPGFLRKILFEEDVKEKIKKAE